MPKYIYIFLEYIILEYNCCNKNDEHKKGSSDTKMHRNCIPSAAVSYQISYGIQINFYALFFARLSEIWLKGDPSNESMSCILLSIRFDLARSYSSFHDLSYLSAKL